MTATRSICRVSSFSPPIHEMWLTQIEFRVIGRSAQAFAHTINKLQNTINCFTLGYVISWSKKWRTCRFAPVQCPLIVSANEPNRNYRTRASTILRTSPPDRQNLHIFCCLFMPYDIWYVSERMVSYSDSRKVHFLQLTVSRTFWLISDKCATNC